MAATFADTLLSPSGSPVVGALVRVTPLESAALDIRAVSALTGSGGTFSLSIPSGIACGFWLPAAGLNRTLIPADGAVITLTDALEGDASGAREAGWLW